MYSVHLTIKAQNALKKLDKFYQERIRNKLKSLKENPRLGKPLTANLSGMWSLRIGKCRAIYAIKDKELIVLVLDIAHRKKVY